MIIRLKGDERLVVVDENKKQQTRKPGVSYGMELPFVIEFYHDDGSAFAEEELTVYSSFQFAIDEDLDFTTNPPVLANNETTTFIISGNTISFTVMTDSAAFKALIGNSLTGDAYAEFKAYKPGKTRPGLAPVFEVKAYNAVAADSSEAPSSSPELYITIAEAYALVQAAPERQYSVDGATLWHDTQVSADRYYREQRNGGEWSEAIALVDNSDFSGYGTKTTLVDNDTVLGNNSEDSGNPIVVTMLKIWNYITAKRFPGTMTIGNLMKYGTGGTGEDAGVAVSTDGTLASDSDANIPTEKAVKAYADTKETALGFTPENTANKGVANGYASLDANGKLPASQLNLNSTTRVKDDIAARDAITDMVEGTECWVTDASADATVNSGAAKYLYNGSAWIKTAEAESLDVITAWENITSKPQIITDIAAVTGSDNDVLQKVSGSWVSRTMAQLKAALGLDNVTNESKTTMFSNPVFTGTVTAGVIKPAADATDAIKITKADGTTEVITVDTTNVICNLTGGLLFDFVGTGAGLAQNYLFQNENEGLAVQSKTPGKGAYWALYTNDGDSTDQTRFSLFGKGTPNNIGNRERLYFGWDGSTNMEIVSESAGTGTARPLNIYTNGNSGQLYLSTNGNIGFMTTSPTAKLHIAAGTATAGTAPLKFTAGTLLTTPEAGAMEFDGSNLFITISSTRKTIATEDRTPIISSGDGAPTSTPGKVGDSYVDTTNKKLYFATGTSSSSDWTAAN